MRNLKKVLSLTLALVMLLGMMVVGASAAEYADSGEIEYKEAAEVMSAIGVFNGTDGNKFNPQGNLTRAQAAKIITYMVLGKTVADKLPNDNSKFSDCPNGEWYVGSVNYLSDTGIVAGQGNGTFNPDGNVTGVEFAKMLLGVLGYDAVTEKFVNDPSWAANIAVRARQAGLDANMTTQTVNSVALNRDQASMMAFNTLTATMMSYVGGTDVTTPDGTIIKVGGQLTPVRNETGSKGQYDNSGNIYMQFCEQYFPGLKLATANTTETDDFGRYLNVWKLDNKTVCEAATWAADATFTSKVKEADVKAAIGKATGRDSGTDRYGDPIPATELVVNGKSTRPGDDITAEYIADTLSGNGRLVEIYLTDDLTQIYQVVVVDTAVGTVTRVDSRNEKITIKLDATTVANGVSLTTDVGYGEFEKDDVVLVTAAADEDATSGKITGNFSVVSVTEPKIVTGIANRKDSKTITLDGTKYSNAYGSTVDIGGFTIDSENESTLYLDAYDNMMKAEGKVTLNTGKIMAPTGTYSTLVDGKIVHYVEGIGPDGEKVTLPVANATAASTAAGYKTASYGNPNDNGIYTLAEANVSGAPVASVSTNRYATVNGTIAATANSSTLNGTRYYFASDVKTIYVSNDHKVSVTNGAKAVTAAADITYVLKDVAGGQKMICAIYVPSGANLPVVVEDPDSILYVNGDSTGSVKMGNKTYYYYNAYQNGEKLPADEIFATTNNVTGGFYKVSKNSDEAYVFTADTKVATSGNVKVEAKYSGSSPDGNYITVGGDEFSIVASDTVIIDLTGSNPVNISVSEINDILSEKDLLVSVYADDKNVAKLVYVVKTSGSKQVALTPGDAADETVGGNTVSCVPVTVTGSGTVTLDTVVSTGGVKIQTADGKKLVIADCTPDKLLAFVALFETGADYTGKAPKISIKNAAGTEVMAETGDTLVGGEGGYAFYYSKDNAAFTSAGNYSWTIKCGDTTVASGIYTK